MNRWIALLLVALAGCDLAGSVTGMIPDGIVRVQPKPEYTAWWARVEQCSGLRRSMSEIAWFELPGAASFAYNGKAIYGLYQYPGRITLAERVDRMEDHVEHEMLHALLATMSITEDHPAEYFKVKCPFVAQNPEG